MQRELLSDNRYREISSFFWPDTEKIWFHQIRDDGRHYSENLDLIKEDLRKDILNYKIDTVFIFLSTGAKILCYELAKEMKIRAVDFGSIPRGLTYSATPGYQPVRATHNPFFFRIPFDVYMDAFEKAYPNLPVSAIISKALAQLIRELSKKKLFAFNTADGFVGGEVDLSRENLANFNNPLRSFRLRYLFLVKQEPDLRRLYKAFDFWCLKKGIGIRGKIFLILVQIKTHLRKLSQRLRLGPLYLKFKQKFIWRFNEKFGYGLKVLYYRDYVRKLILNSPPIVETTSSRCEIHTLVSLEDWLNLLWMLKSFYYYSGCNYSLCIHDDGTLTQYAFERLKNNFPNARIILRQDADIRMSELLSMYPRCRNFRNSNIRALKVFDFVAYLKTDRMLILDSDILFFSKPARLLEATEGSAERCNMLNRDWRFGYSVNLEDMQHLVDFPVQPLINSGLGLIHKNSIPLPLIEHFLGFPNILSNPHLIEQTTIALSSLKFGFKMLPEEYNVYLGKLLPGFPCRHYTGPVRHLMYSEGIRVLYKNGFLNKIKKN